MRPDVLHSRRHRGYAFAILAASFLAIATGASADDKFLQPDPEEMVVTGSYEARSATQQSRSRLRASKVTRSIIRSVSRSTMRFASFPAFKSLGKADAADERNSICVASTRIMSSS